VFLRVGEEPLLVVAWAGGFATGNAVGIAIERKLALGRCVVRMISRDGDAVARAVEPPGKVLATFDSELADGARKLVFVVLNRRDLPELLDRAQKADPELFWVVERFSETSHLTPLPHATGWRAMFKMK